MVAPEFLGGSAAIMVWCDVFGAPADPITSLGKSERLVSGFTDDEKNFSRVFAKSSNETAMI